MNGNLQKLKTMQYYFSEFGDRFNEFWGTFQNVISIETSRFLGNVLQLDPGKKSKTAIHFDYFNVPFVITYRMLRRDDHYRCMMVLERIGDDGSTEYITHCFFDSEGNIYTSLEATTSGHTVVSEQFILTMLSDLAERLLASNTARAKELDGTV
jgi:hypothetical protein